MLSLVLSAGPANGGKRDPAVKIFGRPSRQLILQGGRVAATIGMALATERPSQIETELSNPLTQSTRELGNFEAHDRLFDVLQHHMNHSLGMVVISLNHNIGRVNWRPTPPQWRLPQARTIFDQVVFPGSDYNSTDDAQLLTYVCFHRQSNLNL